MRFEPTEADIRIEECLRDHQSFAVVAGAGSGKTTSLVRALEFVRDHYGRELKRKGQKVACITYTKRACAVIGERLRHDPLIEISTIHSFLWNQVHQFTDDIRSLVAGTLIPEKIEKLEEKDNGGQSQRARRAREQISELQEALIELPNLPSFNYDDSQYSDFRRGLIGHDDVIDLSAALIASRPLLRTIIGLRFPFIFVDEAQDTFESVVAAFNAICEPVGLPIVGYFGDPMQQIYETGVGEFAGPAGFELINKEENFRSATSIVTLANALRDDIEQRPGPDNALIAGSIRLVLVEAETPEAPRNRYSDAQLDRALRRFDRATEDLGWEDHSNAKRLYLVRQMIARRLGFLELHKLFTGKYASSRAQDEFESGDHFLLRPFVRALCPLLRASMAGDDRKMVDILRETSWTFNVDGPRKASSLREMVNLAQSLSQQLSERWKEGNIRDVLTFARNEHLCLFSDRLKTELDRAPREEEFDPEEYAHEKSDWLVDEFFSRSTDGLLEYVEFINDNTAFSTQHGAKGEEYDDVLVVFDDIEAGWNQYSFNKLLIPSVVGEPTEGQLSRSRKLAYVCFTRARCNLNVILFCPNPMAAKIELTTQGIFSEDQIEILPL